MNERYQLRSFLVAGAASLVIFSGVAYLVVGNLRQEMVSPEPEQWQPAGEDAPQLSQDAIATLGQNFITSMSAYDTDQQQPIKSQSVEPAGPGLWTAKYEVEQEEAGSTQVYFYTLEIQDGRVIKQHVALSDRTRSILVSSPEPHTIIERAPLSIKGQAFGGQNELTIRLFGQNSDEPMIEQQIAIQDSQGNPYSSTIDLAAFEAGNYRLTVSDGSATVEASFVLAAK